MKNAKRKGKSQTEYRWRVKKSSYMRAPTPLLPAHLSVVNVHGLRLYVNNAYWESHRQLGIGGPGWEVAEREDDGLYLHASSSVHVVGSRYTPNPTAEDIRIHNLECQLHCLKEQHRREMHKAERRATQAEQKAEEAQESVERRIKEAVQKAEKQAEQRVQEAYAERDHAQAHVRKICSELLRRDEYQHAHKYLNKQLRKIPQTEHSMLKTLS